MANRKRLLYKEKCSFIFVSDEVVWFGQPQTQDRKELFKQESIRRGVMTNYNTIFWLVEETVELRITGGRTCSDRELFIK